MQQIIHNLNVEFSWQQSTAIHNCLQLLMNWKNKNEQQDLINNFFQQKSIYEVSDFEKFINTLNLTTTQMLPDNLDDFSEILALSPIIILNTNQNEIQFNQAAIIYGLMQNKDSNENNLYWYFYKLDGFQRELMPCLNFSNSWPTCAKKYFNTLANNNQLLFIYFNNQTQITQTKTSISFHSHTASSFSETSFNNL